VPRNKQLAVAVVSVPRLAAAVTLGFTVLVALAVNSWVVHARANSVDRIPSYVAWTPDTIAIASSGSAFQGMLLAKRCNHCHGDEGFSAVRSTPNLAGMNRLAIWKQL
jgi:cytochrome c553